MEPNDAPGRPRGSGSQRALRAANRTRLLIALRDRGPSTQAELARHTGLSAATVSNLVKVLTAEDAVETTTATSSGRRAVIVSLSPTGSRRFAVGIDIGRRHLRILCCTASRHILGERVIPLPVGHRPEDTLPAASRLLGELLDAQGLSRSDIIGCTVGIPGPIDARTGQIAHGAILPPWVGLPLAEHVTDILGLPVIVENDANLGALAEVWWGRHEAPDNLIFVKVGTGIGAGLILDGQLHRGHIGITGELGHITVSEFGAVCRCGSRGCLETVASTAAMLDVMRAGHPRDEPQLEQLLQRAATGDPAVLRIVEDAALALGRVLGGVANILGPRIIVLGGPIAPLGDLFVGPTRRGLTRWAGPVVASATEIVMSSLDVRAEALGACARALQDDPEHGWTPAATPILAPGA